MTIVAYKYYSPVFSFPLQRKQLNHDPTEFTARENSELFLISELHKIKNPFSLFRQRTANRQITTIWAKVSIDTYRINFFYQKMELQGNIASLQYCLWKQKTVMILERI